MGKTSNIVDIDNNGPEEESQDYDYNGESTFVIELDEDEDYESLLDDVLVEDIDFDD